MRKISIINQKGGVAKTTTALNLAAELSRKGQHVLLLDLDAQYSATSAIFGIREFDVTAYDVIIKRADMNKGVVSAGEFGFDILPSDILLSAADLCLAHEIGREKILSNQLKNANYDYILYDCPPSLGLISVNALTASDEVIIPVCPEYFSLRGIRLLEKILTDVEANLIVEPFKKRVLITRFKDRIITREAETLIRNHFGEKVFETMIPENIKLEEAHNAHLPIYKYDGKSKGAKAYAALCKEVMGITVKKMELIH